MRGRLEDRLCFIVAGDGSKPSVSLLELLCKVFLDDRRVFGVLWIKRAGVITAALFIESLSYCFTVK